MSTTKLPDQFHIYTQRLVLRPPVLSDIEGLWPHVTDSRLTRFLAWEPHTERDQTRIMIQSLIDAQAVGRGFHWIVELAGQVVGLGSLIDVRRQHRCWTINRAELAYWIGAEFQQKGIATEASRAIVEFAFNHLGLNKVVLYHASDNLASGVIPLRLGFRYVGEEQEAFNKSGQWHSLKYYELLKSYHRAGNEV